MASEKVCANCLAAIVRGGMRVGRRTYYCDEICWEEKSGLRPRKRAGVTGWVNDVPGRKRVARLLVTVEMEQRVQGLDGYNPVYALMDGRNKEYVARLLHLLFEVQLYGYNCKVTVSDGGP